MRRDCRVITEALDELENNSAGNTPKSAEAVRFQFIFSVFTRRVILWKTIFAMNFSKIHLELMRIHYSETIFF